MSDATRRRRRIEPTDDWEQLKLLCLEGETKEFEQWRYSFAMMDQQRRQGADNDEHR
jgi:hypothetical protein